MDYFNYKGTKIKTNELEKLDITEFKSACLLNGRMSTDITFRDGLKAKLCVYAFRPNGYMNIIFPKQAQQFDETIKLDTSRCYLGGYRYWFICSGRGEHHCNNRVRILYRVGLEFACRQCHNLAYESNSTGKSKFYMITKWNKLRDKILNLTPKVKRKKYAGKETKNNIKLANLIRQYEASKGRVFLILERMQARETRLKKEGRYL